MSAPASTASLALIVLFWSLELSSLFLMPGTINFKLSLISDLIILISCGEQTIPSNLFATANLASLMTWSFNELFNPTSFIPFSSKLVKTVTPINFVLLLFESLISTQSLSISDPPEICRVVNSGSDASIPWSADLVVLGISNNLRSINMGKPSSLILFIPSIPQWV